jgi:hypothetical protein
VISSRALFAALALLAFSGCSHVEPWVKPYERENLADPIMAWDRDPVASSYMRHVEGATGGGCGCN